MLILFELKRFKGNRFSQLSAGQRKISTTFYQPNKENEAEILKNV